MTRRPGTTMTEVLVTIFVVSIGLSGVMAMFPFGAKQMSEALISDRATSHAISTDGLVRGYWKEKVVEDPNNTEPFWVALDNPGGGLPDIRLKLNEPSYPVFLDPIGWFGRGSLPNQRVGDTPTSVPRRSMNLVTSGQQALRLFSQADGFSWDEDSRPLTNAAEMRELRYNSLAVIQRPTNRDKFGATLKVVVFLNRKYGFNPAGSEAVFPNTQAPAAIRFNPGTTQIQLPASADIKKGSWIMDATVSGAIRHANFYRVVSATENTTGLYDVELHTSIKRVDGGTAAYDGTVVVMAGVADVFDRPVLSLSGSLAP